ncbi:hypothetical protein [Chelativorans sp. YIM 93263]|uniref:hypothetical protein n=1 Tax=Chelativorans sp. YIM 93263 TaxID=2906648 RepID=UPI002378DAEE|nr:hypothetical protein [Chelativorans sp. YIM 93263]
MSSADIKSPQSDPQDAQPSLEETGESARKVEEVLDSGRGLTIWSVTVVSIIITSILFVIATYFW